MSFVRHLSPRLVLVAVACLMSLASAHAETRVALVIGNGAYQNAPRLPNPSNDATDAAIFSVSEPAPAARSAVLYEEDPSDPQGKRSIGQVVWRAEHDAGTNGTSDIAIRADVNIPERGLKATLTIRRNTDPSLPASHTMQITFQLTPDFAGGSVVKVPGILMKRGENVRGTPLMGLAVEVTENSFLVGLSNAEADRGRNLQMLKEQAWFDIPIVYANQRRAILALQKGAAGEQVFADVLESWNR